MPFMFTESGGLEEFEMVTLTVDVWII